MEDHSRIARRRAGGHAVKASPPLRIGVIADTHGLYDPAVEQYFAGVTEIFHAGDIGNTSVLQRLRQLAPVTVVSGNVDDYEKSGFPPRIITRRGGCKIALCHVLYEKGRMTKEAEAWLNQVQPDVCIFGHSHKPTLTQQGRTMLFNPGSAGPKRFSLPRGIGLLTITGRKITPSLIRLEDRVASRKASSRCTVRRTKGAC
jgi:putative phosphoesterase